MYRIPEFARGLLNGVVVVPCRYTRWIFAPFGSLAGIREVTMCFYYTKKLLNTCGESGAKSAVAVLNAQTTIASPCFESWVAEGLGE